MAQDAVAEALRVLLEAGLQDLLSNAAWEILTSSRSQPARRAADGMAAAVFTCFLPRQKMQRGAVVACPEQEWERVI